jgi:hypothetical protein
LKLLEIVTNGDTGGLVQYLMSGGDPVGETGDLLLHLCIQNGRTDIAEILMQYGADYNQVELDSGWSVLHEAVFRNNEEMVRLLLKKGASISGLITEVTKDSMQFVPGDTPLTVSEKMRRDEIATLIRRQIDADSAGGVQIDAGGDTNDLDPAHADDADLPGFERGESSAWVICGKGCEATVNQAFKVAAFCRTLSRKNNIKLVSIPCGNISGSDESMVKIVIGVEVASVHSADDQSQLNSEQPLTRFDDAVLRDCFDRALGLSGKFWKELSRVSYDIEKQPFKVFLAAAGNTGQSRLTYPNGEIIELQNGSGSAIEVVVHDGNYSMELY